MEQRKIWCEPVYPWNAPRERDPGKVPAIPAYARPSVFRPPTPPPQKDPWYKRYAPWLVLGGLALLKGVASIAAQEAVKEVRRRRGEGG